MKNSLIIIAMTLVLMSCISFLSEIYAQATFQGEVEATTNAFDLSTFAGIVACISLIVTQLAKMIPAISEKAIFKILTSLVIGISLTFFAWWLNLASFLENMIWWQVLIQGVLSGGAACGIYDLIKSLFNK